MAKKTNIKKTEQKQDILPLEKANIASTPPSPPSAPASFGRYGWMVGIGILALFNVVFFHEQIFGLSDFWSDYWADWTEITVPFFKLNVLAAHNGEIPFWNPYAHGGVPHVSDPTSLFFYPVFYIAHYLVSPDADLFKIVQNLIVLHFFILSVNMFFLARNIKLSFWSAIFAAVAFTYSCAVLCKWQYVVVICGMAWMPLVFLYFYKIFKSNSIKWSDVGLAGLFLAFNFAGHPQFFFYNLVFIGLTTIVGLFLKYNANKSEGYKQVVMPIGGMGLAVMLAVGVLAIQIFHTYEMIPLTQRDKIAFDFAADGSFKFENFLTFLSPKIFGYFKGGEPLDYSTYFLTPGRVYHYWETAYFFGVIPLLFGVYGFFKIPKKGIITALLVTSIFMLLHAMGSSTFFYKMIFGLPGFNLFRVPTRTMLFPVLLACLSAGWVFDQLRAQQRTGRDKVTFYVLLTLLVFGSLYLMSSFGSTYKLSRPDAATVKLYGLTAMAMLIAGALFFAFSSKFSRSYNAFVIGLIILTFIDLAIPNKSYKNGSQDASLSLALDTNTLSALTPQKDSLFRYAPTNLQGRIFKRNQATYQQFYSTDGFYAFIFHKPDNMEADFPADKLLAIKLKSDIRDDGTGNRQAFFVQNEIYPHQRMTYDLITDPNKTTYKSNDFAKTSIVEKMPSTSVSGKSPQDVAHSIQQSYYGYSKADYEVETAEPGLLVIGDYYFPNWKAYVDGQSTELIRTNFLTRGVMVPSGKHKVSFRFESSYFEIGKWVTILSLVLIVALLILDKLRERKNAVKA